MSGVSRPTSPASRAVVAATWLLASISATACAQQPAGKSTPLQRFPFSDPQQMMDRIFGTDSQAESQALENVEISIEDEERIGSEAAERYLDWLRQQHVRLRTRGRDVDYLQALVDVVQPQMEHADRYDHIRIVVARSPLPDARSFPGGTVVIFDGLLDFADSEAALVGVIGHELSHLDRGHQLTRVKGQKLAEQTFAGGGAGKHPNFMNTGPVLMRLWSRPFRPEDETAADRDGAQWAYHAGYDPREMAKLFLRLHEKNRERRANVALPGFLRSHPYEVERHAAVMQMYEQMQADEPRDDLCVGRENLLQRQVHAAHNGVE